MSRRLAAAAIGFATALAVGTLATLGAAQAADKVNVQLAWFVNGDYAGYYQAAATGIYKKYNLDVDFRAGGPQVDGAQMLIAGRVDFLTATAFAGLNYAKEKLPFMVVGAIYQKDPQILMVHRDSGYNSLEDLRGKPIIIGASSRSSFWPFLRAKYGYTDDQIRPFTFNYAPFLADKTSAQQGYVNLDLFHLRKMGQDPKFFLLSDGGFDNYANTINTSRKLVESNPDLVQRFVNATIEGWSDYLNGDPKPAWTIIKSLNQNMTDEELEYSRSTIKERGIVDSGDAKTFGIGAMTDERWARFVKSNIDSGNLSADIAWQQAYTLKFVNQKVGVK